MNHPSIRDAVTALSKLHGQILSMPLPKRLILPEVVNFKRAVLEQAYDLLLNKGTKEMSSSQALEQLYQDPFFMSKVNAGKFDHVTLVSMYMCARHLAAKAPTFTVNPALNLLLEDTGIKNDVPALFLAPPYPTCFLEFDPAERREQSTHQLYSGGFLSICEGAFIQETKMDNLLKLRAETREILGLDPHLPARVLEIGFSSSPANNQNALATGLPAAFDNLDLMSIYIQDENEPIKNILERHVQFYTHRHQDQITVTSGGKTFTQLFEDNFAYLTKVLFYLNVEKKSMRKENEASDLEKRIEGVAEKKRDKLKRQLQRVYDRIVVGPDHYTPIKDLLPHSELPKGTKAPHYRRGYFGIRWKGHGQAKTAELIRVSHALVNMHLLKDPKQAPKTPKDYEIR
jgi:hypothetical protein